jgi:periplasmic protein TonB
LPTSAPSEISAARKTSSNSLHLAFLVPLFIASASVSVLRKTRHEANRDVLDGYPNLSKLGYGLSLTIPSLFQPEPKLETKVLPVYPPGAASQHIHGEVAMDVTLNDDGTVQEVKLIEGDPLLADAATAAVKQWKYHPRMVHGKLVNSIVVVLTFEKNGKVR